MRLLREALTDESGQGDIPYVAIGALTMTAIASLTFIFVMSTISYAKCQPITTISKGDQSVTSVIPCNFDPLPLGQASGLIFGAFAALIGSLAGYMAATRKQRPNVPQVNAPGVQINQASTQMQPESLPPAKPKARKKPRRRR